MREADPETWERMVRLYNACPAETVTYTTCCCLLRRHGDQRSAFGAKFAPRLSDNLPAAP